MFEGILFFKEYVISAVIISVVAYFVGCINSSIIVTRLFKAESDIRSVGSGNAGFTNVLRTMGKKMALLTFIGDFAKGVLAVWSSKVIVSFFPSTNDNVVFMQCCLYLAGLMCLMGHIYPCFFGFKGGKGVLTTWASTLLIDWRIFLIIIAVFLIVLLCTKIVSASSIVAAVSYPIVTFLITYRFDFYRQVTFFPTGASLFMALIVIYKHKSNILKLINGTEKKLSVHK